MIVSIIKWLMGGVVEKYFDYKIQKAKSDNERLNIEAEKEVALTSVRASVLREGGWWFQLFFIIPIAMHFFSVLLYSMFWCETCIYPYAGLDYRWVVAAIPEPLDQAYPYILGYLFLVKVTRW